MKWRNSFVHHNKAYIWDDTKNEFFFRGPTSQPKSQQTLPWSRERDILKVLVIFDKLTNLIYFGNPILLRFFFRRRCTDRQSQKMELKNTPPLINLDKAYAKAQHRLFYGNCMESQGIPPGTEASLPDGGGGLWCLQCQWSPPRPYAPSGEGGGIP